MTSKALKDQHPAIRATPIFSLIPPFKDVREDRAAVEAEEKQAKEAAKDLDLEDRAWTAWSDAWDRAKQLDEKAGRRYDRAKYAEKAHAARLKILTLGAK